MSTLPALVDARPCPVCGVKTDSAVLEQTRWLSPDIVERIGRAFPWWRRADGACPACIQHALLETLRCEGDAALHDVVQTVWPIDSEAAYGALPTPLRMHADPRYTGRGVTLAMVDSGFYPHADLMRISNRVRAWVDASQDPVRVCWNPQGEWPGSEAALPSQWHGLMTSVVAAGSGWTSHGLYAGIAADANVVLLQVSDGDGSGRIRNSSIARALHWLLSHSRELCLGVVNLSVCGDPEPGNPIDAAVAALVEGGVVVVAAAGNDGIRKLTPPASTPQAITAGGLDDHNTLDGHSGVSLWHSNYGEGGKPELVAPSLWVVAPLLPGTREIAEARQLFENGSDEAEIRRRKLVRPEYQLVEGTSFAAPIVSSIVCTMLEANPELTPQQVRHLLLLACTRVPGASPERQGAGAVDAGLAVALALAGRGSSGPFAMCRCEAETHAVRMLGAWDNWSRPGIEAIRIRPGVWGAPLPAALPPGTFAYKFQIDGGRDWRLDSCNPRTAPDGFGGVNSILSTVE